jgi:hypothetical protein
MNELENYKAILEEYFGVGTATFNTTNGATNPVTKALNHADFSSFRSNFLGRFKRLATRYPKSDSSRKPLLKMLNEVASGGNWDGAYAELVAFDFLNSDQDWLSTPIKLSITVPASETLSGDMGNQYANFDGFYDDFGACFDVKVLSDKSRAILDGIIDEIKRHFGISGVVVSSEFPLDLDFELFQQNRNRLLSELEGAIEIAAQTTFVKSHVIPDLAYRLMWQGGMLTTSSTYDPYLHAANHHTLLFKHAKKFSKTQPNLIVFVVFPWFSEKVTNLNDCNKIFYRSLCRRFFCQYAKETSSAKTILKYFQGNETVAEVTDKLAGVLILKDNSITSSNVEALNVEGLAYLNPNAAHKVSGHFRCHLSSLGFAVDDFEHDNY